jgi:transposase
VIGSTRSLRVFAYASPADMRKGFDGLYGLVRQHLKQDPFSGDLYLFVSGNRRRAKVLMWDGTGLCVYAKRLEKGRFAQLWGDDPIELTVAELQLFLEGSALVGKVRVSPARLCLRCLTEATEIATIARAKAGADPGR